jgi:type I restriction enzyme S subunit
MKQGWEIKKLGDVCDTGAGGTPLKAHKDYYEGGTIPWLMSGEVSQGEVFEAKNFITEKGLKNSSAKLFPINTVLVAMYGATAGQVGILKFEACTNQAVCGILPNDKTIPEYLFYCLLSKKDELVAQAVGGAQPNISQIKIRNTKIPLPSLPEPQSIVAILDEAFAAIAKAKANAEQNLKNAKELFESYLQGVFENKGEGWEEKTFNDVCNLVGGSQPSKDDFIYEPKEGYIRLIQVRDYRTSKYITYIPKDKAKRFCSENDIMIGRYGPPIFGIFKGLEGAYNVALMKAEVNTKICNSDYFFWFLKTNKLRVFVENSSKRAAGQDGIRKELLDKYPVPLPKSLKEQKIIVQKLDALSIETKKLETIYQQKINDLEELKKSILQKAFSGELKTATALV